MKTYKISSPAYRANGYYGTYLSIAICENDGTFIKVFGDHAHGVIGESFFYPSYKNINEIVGIPFSDADRFISISEVNVNMDMLNTWANDYIESKIRNEEWYAKRAELFGNSPYDFQYTKKGKPIPENIEKYSQWIAENPAVKTVDFYDFLKAIVNEN